jgi:hypothetical protein
MTDEEELKLKWEENKKLDEEGDRLFFVRLGRFALVVNVFITPFLILPGFAAWRALEAHDLAWSKPFFWNNLGWLLLSDLYAAGVFGIICAFIYLAGGTRGWKLCGVTDIFSESATEGTLMFWLSAFGLIFPYVFIVWVGMVCNSVYVMWIK